MDKGQIWRWSRSGPFEKHSVFNGVLIFVRQILTSLEGEARWGYLTLEIKSHFGPRESGDLSKPISGFPVCVGGDREEAAPAVMFLFLLEGPQTGSNALPECDGSGVDYGFGCAIAPPLALMR